MTASEFKIGDIVLLNSGSPPLTVVDLFEQGGQKMARVRWKTEGIEFGSEAFPIVCLRAHP